jgi:CRISPR-associated Cas5-like protein
MKNQSVRTLTYVIALSLLVGCGGEPDSSTGERKSYPLPPPPGVGGMSPAGAPEATGSDTAAPDPESEAPANDEPASAPAPAEEEAVERVKADVGAAKKGRSLDEYEGVVVTPAKSLFAVQERMVFQVQIPKAMQTYEAINGGKPKSHEEYMTKIIEENLIKLPELPTGQRYAYDPEQGELMVEKPK